MSNIIPVDLVLENRGVYGRQSDKRRYTPLFICIAYSEFLLRFLCYRFKSNCFFLIINFGKIGLLIKILLYSLDFIEVLVQPLFKEIASLLFWIPVNRYFANSEDPDEMLHKAAFHHGLHCLLR